MKQTLMILSMHTHGPRDVEMELCTPVALTRLPKPFSNGGKVQFGPVWGLRNSTRKRRHEICAAVDGDSINIYSAQTGQVVYSHAVPPTTSFASAPISIRWTQAGIVRRQICAAVQDDGICIQSIVSNADESRSRPEETSLRLRDSASQVIHLDILEAEEARTIIVLQEDGTVTAAKSDLQEVRSMRMSIGPQASQSKILAASFMYKKEATKTLLKNRNDLQKSLSDRSLVAQVFGVEKSQSTRLPAYSIWCLPEESFTSKSTMDVQKLFEHTFSDTDLSPAKSLSASTVNFGPRATSLQIRTSKGFFTYRLDGSTPTRVSAYHTHSTGQFDALSLSLAYSLVALPESLQIFDAKYEVLQNSLDLKKRKQPGTDAAVGTMIFVTYFAQMRRVLARKGFSIIAIDLRIADEKMARNTNVPRLGTSVGRGMRNPATSEKFPLLNLSFTVPGKTEAETWPLQKDGMDRMIADGNIAKFDEIALNILQVNESCSNFCDVIIDYIFTKMFSISNASEDCRFPTEVVLRLNFVPSKLFRYLNTTGRLCLWRLKQALRHTTLEQTLSSLPLEAIPQALHDADDSAKLLRSYVKHNNNVDLREQLSTVRYLIELAKRKSEAAGLNHDEALPASDALVVIGQNSSEFEPISADAQSLPEALLQAIVTSLNKLGGFGHSQLSTGLQYSMSATNIITLIQFLRQQLFQGGHASWQLLSTDASSGTTMAGTDGSNTSKKSSARPLRLDTIVKLLSACLDTIGPLQLLATASEEASVEAIVPDLLSEVELSAQYIEESAELQGVIRETLRFAQSRDSQDDNALSSSRAQGASRGMGDYVTLYSQHVEDEANNGSAAMLPLSLKDEASIDPVKVRKGGGQVTQRSAREMLMLEARQKDICLREVDNIT